MRLQEQIKNIMDTKDITAYQISKDLNISESQLSKFFNGKVNFSLNKLFDILEYLNCELKVVEKRHE